MATRRRRLRPWLADGDADPLDDHGHGTHVAGIAAAGLGNGAGIAGLAQVEVYVVKVLNAFNSGTWSNVAQGLQWCADHTPPRTVVNLSLGGTNPPQAVRDAVDNAVAAGKLLVAAAGNRGPCTECVLWPAAHPDVVAVGCTDAADAICPFSSRGQALALAAPGAGVLSAWGASDAAYETLSGTSMSAPHASGAAALLWSHEPGLSALEVEHRLLATASDLGPAGHDAAFGHGRLDAHCALTCPVDPPGPPQNLTADREGLAQVRLAWHAPSDPWARYVTGYTVWRADSSGGPYAFLAALPPVLEFVDGDAGPVGSRFYTVTATNVGGEGAPSAEACNAPLAPPAPGLPCVGAPAP